MEESRGGSGEPATQVVLLCYSIYEKKDSILTGNVSSDRKNEI